MTITPQATKKKRIVTGVQPTGTGDLHIGNYCGFMYPIKKAIENGEMNKNDIYIFVADLHSMTVKNIDLRKKSLSIIKSLYVFNLTTNLYIQSDIRSICEGLWLLSQFTTTGEMNRMTQFKDKQDMAGSTIGLYTYPVLMAADILFMNATDVPVGEDQTQHMEIARDIGERVNQFAKKSVFVIPEMYSMGKPIRIMSLNDVTKKMSKSSPEGCLFLTDDETTVRNKIKRAQTDSLPFPSSEEELESRPAADNLVTIYSIISNRSVSEVIQEFQGLQWSAFKSQLADLLVIFTGNFQSQFSALDDNIILSLIQTNGERIKSEVDSKIHEVYKLFF